MNAHQKTESEIVELAKEYIEEKMEEIIIEEIKVEKNKVKKNKTKQSRSNKEN